MPRSSWAPWRGRSPPSRWARVYMGALTYIGNAPNLIVRAIAEERGIKMPNFFGICCGQERS